MRSDITQTIQLLAEAGARFIVVGGVAVVLHGHLRLTTDLDLVLSLEEENVRKALEALARDGFRPRAPVRMSDFADAEVRRTWIEEKNLKVFSLWNPSRPGFEVDLFVDEPFEFASAWSRAVVVDIERQRVRVVAVSDLIEMKRNAGRALDLDDIEALRELSGRTPNRGKRD